MICRTYGTNTVTQFVVTRFDCNWVASGFTFPKNKSDPIEQHSKMEMNWTYWTFWIAGKICETFVYYYRCKFLCCWQWNENTYSTKYPLLVSTLNKILFFIEFNAYMNDWFCYCGILCNTITSICLVRWPFIRVIFHIR